MKINLIEEFLNALEESNINYVHWKSNTNIEKALSGEDDLDILVDSNKKHKIYTILKKLNFIRGYSEKDSWQNEIFHYFGMDINKKELVHVHLHFLLEVGYDFDKSVNLPIVEQYISNKIKYKSIYIPEVEKEYILLIIRLILKNAFIPFLLLLPTAKYRYYKRQKSTGIVTGSAYREFEDLHNRIDKEKLQKVLQDIFPFINSQSFKNYETTIIKNNSLKDYFSAARKLKQELRKYKYFNTIQSFLLSFYRINIGRIHTILKNQSYFKKTPQNGGRIFAFVGGDGAGKSTNIEKLYKILTRHFYTVVIHVGRPKKQLIGTLLRIVSKLGRFVGLTNLASAIGFLAIAYDRKKSFEKALKIKNKGGIVILDRIPLEDITAMDCPRVHTISNGKYKYLSKIEKKMYSTIKEIDELIVLKLDPKIALQRRPEDDPNELLIRSGQIWEKDFSKIDNAHVINTSNSFNFVEENILKIVWTSITKKPTIYEVLGLAGTGKSTIRNIISLKYPKIKFDIPSIKMGNFIFILKNIPMSIYILIKTKKIMFAQIYLQFQIFHITLRKQELPTDKINIFDQGPIYIIAILIKEIPSLEVYFTNELKKILLHFDAIIYLEAPIDTLMQRIQTREQEHRIKNLSIDKKEAFLKNYLNIYNKIINTCYQQGLIIHSINTDKHSIQEVEKQIITIINERTV